MPIESVVVITNKLPNAVRQPLKSSYVYPVTREMMSFTPIETSLDVAVVKEIIILQQIDVLY